MSVWRPLMIGMVLASDAGAQEGRASLSGVVRDSSRAPVPLVQVSVGRIAVATDSAGRFELLGLPAGRHTIVARRLGFSPQQVPVVLTGGRADTMTIVLRMLPRDIAGVTTEASVSGRMADFARHRISGMGTYFDRKQLEARNTPNLSDILRRLPGIRVVTDRAGRTHIRMGRVAGGRDCPPNFWIDGVQSRFLGVDDVPVADIEALEVYKGQSGLPPEFNARTGNPSCGTVVIWTRIPG